MNNYKELFKRLESEVESSKLPPHAEVNWYWYRRIAEQIALNGKSMSITIAILLSAVLGATVLVEEMRISKREHIILEQKNLLKIDGKDSISFQCVHCGWNHSLQIKNK